MRVSKEKRLLRLAGLFLLLIALGIGYAFVAGRFRGLPCVFHLLTGLKCPGCGVTRMCLSLLHGDYSDAFSQNAAVFCLLPVGAVLAVTRSVSYVKTGSHQLARWENGLTWAMIILLVLFGFVRNLVGI